MGDEHLFDLTTEGLLERATALDAKATKGPWCGHMERERPISYTITSREPDNRNVAADVLPRDATFISTARELLPELARRLKAAEDKLARLVAADRRIRDAETGTPERWEKADQAMRDLMTELEGD